MTEFELDCETCRYEDEASSIGEALRAERDHRAERGTDHRVTIRRRRDAGQAPERR